MPTNPASFYLNYCRRILLEPGAFFREEFHRLQLSTALTLGIFSAWGSAALVFFSSSLTSIALEKLFAGWLDEMIEAASMFSEPSEAARAFLLQASFVLIYPFLLLWYLAATASVIFLFSRIFIQDQSQVSYKNCLKILALALGSTWLLAIPIFGEVLAYIAFTLLVIIGIRETFWVTTQRATLVVLAPQVFGLAFVMAMFGVLAIAAIAWVNLMVSSGGF